MLDIGWAELFVVAVIALLVVGPKELPAMLRTIGKFVAMIKRQAQEFRTQFDDAIKDTEFEQVKNDLQDLKSDATSTLRDVREGFSDEMRELDEVRRDLDEDRAKLDAEFKREYGETGATDDGDDDWLEKHNRAVLEAEQADTQSSGGPEAPVDAGTEAAPSANGAAANDTGEPPSKPDAEQAPDRQPEKAGAVS